MISCLAVPPMRPLNNGQSVRVNLSVTLASSPRLLSVSRLIGASFRELQALLETLDPTKNWGGLQAAVNDDGELCFVCPVHARHYHIHE